MDDWTVDPRSELPPFRQVLHAMLDAILRGELRPEEQLPSIRDLAVRVLINPNTVAKAYRELTLLGIVQARSGSGVFVAEEGSARARRARAPITLRAFRRAAEEALRSGHSLSQLEEILFELADESNTLPSSLQRRK
jgi:GntR family transcriptional regulator